MKLYGKTLFFKRGIMLNVNLLYACNLPCTYCTLEMPTGKRPKAKQSTLEQWKETIGNLASIKGLKIREVFVSGGEPSMVDWMPDLVNWLLDEGYHVLVFTNLFRPGLFAQIKKSYRFKIQATYHKVDNPKRFNDAYELARQYHRVDVDEIGTKKLFHYSKLKPFVKMEELKENELRLSPDRQLFMSCYDHFTAKS
jgi:uncharacterized radical SAM superfamily Fe-S cluster-containing enzyme